MSDFNAQDIDPKDLASQLRKPAGNLGYDVARLMEKGNAFIISQTFSNITFSPDKTLLEIGFGNGFHLINYISKVKKIYGLDYSPTMVQLAAKNLQSYMNSNQIELIEGDVQKLPYPDQFFDAIVTINTIYFWDDFENALSELKRVLKPKGELHIGMRTKSGTAHFRFIKHGFKMYEKDEIITLLAKSGLEITHFTYSTDDKSDALSLVCKK